jgi:hypothetical protein
MHMKKRYALALILLTATAPAESPQAGAEGTAGAPPAEAKAEAAQSWEGFMQDRNFDQFIKLDLRPQPESREGTLLVLGRLIPVSEVRWTGDRVTARLGRVQDDLAIEAVRREEWLSGELRQGENVQRFTLREIPLYPAPRDRAEGWGQDLDALTRRFATLDRSLTPGERTLFLEAVEAIRSKVDRLTDAEVIMQMAAAVALADEPHTRLLLLRNATELRRLPIRVWWFDDGLYVVRTTPEYRQLLGCRIADVGHVPVRQARDVAGKAYAGNPSWRDYMTTYVLTSPEAMQGLGITPQLEAVEIGVAGCRGPERRTLRPMPLARSDRRVEAWWDLSPLRDSPHGLSAHALGAKQDRLPLYLKNPNANYWFEFVPASGVLYLQLSRSDNAGSENIKAFGERLFAEMGRRQPRAVVVDLRFNTGGNAGFSREFFRQLNERSANIPRYLITGRATFSAGISAAGQMLSGGPAVILGEPAGDDLDHWSEGGYIRLPNSKLEVDFQTVLHSYSAAPCPRDVSCVDMEIQTLAPEIPVATSWADYASGRDPVLEAALQHLARTSR